LPVPVDNEVLVGNAAGTEWEGKQAATFGAQTFPLAVSQGGTNGATALAGFDNLSPLTTKGDLLVHNGTNNIRLPVGTDGQFLEARASEAAGVRFVTPTLPGTPQRITAAHNAATNEVLMCDTVAVGAFTVTMPGSPAQGDNVQFIPSSSWKTNNLTIGRNGNNIMGLAEDLIVDLDVPFSLVWDDTDTNWRIAQ
jgi:hypothetical protein